MKKTFTDKMKQNPIIIGIKDPSNLDDALQSDCEIIFLLCGTIFNLKDMTTKIKECGKLVFIHVDFINELYHTSCNGTYFRLCSSAFSVSHFGCDEQGQGDEGCPCGGCRCW